MQLPTFNVALPNGKTARWDLLRIAEIMHPDESIDAFIESMVDRKRASFRTDRGTQATATFQKEGAKQEARPSHSLPPPPPPPADEEDPEPQDDQSPQQDQNDEEAASLRLVTIETTQRIRIPLLVEGAASDDEAMEIVERKLASGWHPENVEYANEILGSSFDDFYDVISNSPPGDIWTTDDAEIADPDMINHFDTLFAHRIKSETAVAH